MMQDWFKKAKLGIFIHWGIYAVKGVSESWSFHNGYIDYDEYMDQAKGFTAANYDPEKWAELFKEAGARYAVLTTKHHDGFCLWDTDLTDHNSVDGAPAKTDLIGPYAETIRNAGLKVGMYYSLTDWSREDYRSIYSAETDEKDYAKQNKYETPAGGPEDYEAWERHLELNNEAMKELMTRYGTVDLLWFDGDWERTAEQWKMPEFRKLLHELNPNVVLNSRLRGYGDYKTPEVGMPIVAPEGVWELCVPINNSWGYQHRDVYWKSSREVIRLFVDCLTLGGNLLLDIGPMEDGTIPEQEVKVLKDLGSWIKDNEEAIYDTKAGIGYDLFLGGSTVSEDNKTIYLFVHDRPVESVVLKGLISEVENISLLHNGKKLSAKLTGGSPYMGVPGTWWINLTEEDCHEIGSTVIKIELKEPLELYRGEGKVISFNE